MLMPSSSEMQDSSKNHVLSEVQRNQILSTFLDHFFFFYVGGQLTFTISFINRNLISNIWSLSNKEAAASGVVLLRYSCPMGRQRKSLAGLPDSTNLFASNSGPPKVLLYKAGRASEPCRRAQPRSSDGGRRSLQTAGPTGLGRASEWPGKGALVSFTLQSCEAWESRGLLSTDCWVTSGPLANCHRPPSLSPFFMGRLRLQLNHLPQCTQ